MRHYGPFIPVTRTASDVHLLLGVFADNSNWRST